ncbi:Actin/actin-like protein [Ramaria rubella]|nr:Actin/actin-like protein [Ramaria rubella]
MLPVVVLDNGAYTIKAGVSTSPTATPRIIHNAAIRSKGDRHLYIGHEFEKCRDYASLNYRLSFERGYLTDWDVQKAVWDGLFGSEALSLDLQSTSLLITEPPFNLHSIQEKYDQLAFEEYEFASYVRCPAASLAPYGSIFSSDTPSLPHPECSVVVDSGFSFTHVLPLMQGKILWKGVRRIDVGGKLLTNHLSTLVSFRQWNMLDQTHIVNDVKEKCCYVSSSFSNDLVRCRSGGGSNGITLEYVLPDFSRNRHGFVRGQTIPSVSHTRNQEGGEPMKVEVDQNANLGEGSLSGGHLDDVGEKTIESYQGTPSSDSDQILYMSNERFTVPELIFNPSDIGLTQSGLPQTLAQSISSLPSELQGMFWANIGLIGGNVKFPGFSHRLRQELRALAPVEYEVGVYESKDPIIETYKSAYALANSDDFRQFAVTREEYNEGGSNACRRKFRNLDWDPVKDKTTQTSRAVRRDKDRAESKVAEDSDGADSADEIKITKRAPPKRREKTVSTKPKRELPRGK